MASSESELRHRSNVVSKNTSWKDTVYDASEYMGEKVSQGCQLIQLLVIAALVVVGLAHVYEHISIHHLHGRELRVLVPSEGTYMHLYDHNKLALVLYKPSMPGHLEFLQDAKRANAKHKVVLAQLDCEEHAEACTKDNLALRYDLVHPKHIVIGDDEPVVVYYQHGTATDVYHRSIKKGEVNSPENRKERIQTLIRFLDIASERGSRKLDKVQERAYARGRNGGMFGRYGGVPSDEGSKQPGEEETPPETTEQSDAAGSMASDEDDATEKMEI
jgi:hypothetical protein